MQALAKISGAWKNVKQIFINQAGSWKQVKQGWIKVDGVWKQFYSAFTPVQATGSIATYQKSQYNNSVENGLTLLQPAGTLFSGFALSYLVMGITYDSTSKTKIINYAFGLYFDTSGPQPTGIGNIKVTNLTTGIAMTLSPEPTASPWLWSYYWPNNTGQNYPDNPYDSWIENNSTDVFQFDPA
ncbi:hypothetical protein AVU38_gp060 [Ralstonia phage RSL2]|uniref:Uncharacterized protein n=1 Tax=Ralstonia phage RSL2 TaxID=1585840 RepID=A0A0A8J984_9CAUD|nr:hypothetical protein AVU38_gp060 [Ralstonia phage RSL2]BAQ02588.1 hypothetical protein [Ralstonia phage RSL2]